MWKTLTTRAMLALPVIVLVAAPTSVLFPTTHGKMLVWLLVAPLLTVAWIITHRPVRWSAPVPLVMLGAWVASMMLSAWLGVDTGQSVWGTDTRGFGVWVWVWLAIYAWILAQIFFDTHERARSNAAIYQWTVIALGAMVTIPALVDVARQGVHRAESVFGNPLLFANMSLFPLFIGLYTAATTQSVRWRAAGFGGAAVGAIGVMLTQSRGAFGAMIIGLLVAGVVWVSHTWKPKHIAAAMMACAVLALGAYTLRDAPFMRATGLSRALSVLSFDAGTSQRLILWNTAIRAFRERPWVGWGPENFDYALDRHFDARNETFGLSQAWSDRAHNVLLDVAVMQGTIGLLMYFATFVAALWVCVRSISAGNRAHAFFIGLIVAYVVQSLVAFDGPATAALWVGTLALMGADTSKTYLLPARLRMPMVVLLMLLTIGTLFVIGRSYNASSYMREAEQARDVETRSTSIQKSLAAWSPHRPSLMQRAANLLFENARRDNQSEAARQLQLGIDIMRAAIEESPQRFSFVFTLGNLLTKAAAILDIQFADQAEAVLNEASRLSPQRTSVYFQRANIRILAGDTNGALAILDQALAINPNAKQARYLRGVALLFTDRIDEGLAEIDVAMTGAGRYRPTIENEMNHVFRVAINRGHMRVASRMAALLVEENIENEEYWHNLRIISQEDDIDAEYVAKIMEGIEEHVGYGLVESKHLPRILEIKMNLEK